MPRLDQTGPTGAGAGTGGGRGRCSGQTQESTDGGQMFRRNRSRRSVCNGSQRRRRHRRSATGNGPETQALAALENQVALLREELAAMASPPGTSRE